MRDQILSEIKRLAEANGGKPPGWNTFSKATGIRLHDWRGVYWTKWGDATREAGFEPNTRTEGYGNEFFLKKLADAARHLGAIPNTIQMAMYRRTDPTFPARQTFNKNFASRADMLSRFRKFVSEHPDYADVAAFFPPETGEEKASETSVRVPDDYVYLIQWGDVYKIGRAADLERRVKQVQTGLPERGKLAHSIRTDDAPGIEYYWHRRFADKRTENGEWFRLSRADVAAFKRRKFQ